MNDHEAKLLLIKALADDSSLYALTEEQANEIQKDVTEQINKLTRINATKKIKGLALVAVFDNENGEKSCINACCGFTAATAINVLSMQRFSGELIDEIIGLAVSNIMSNAMSILVGDISDGFQSEGSDKKLNS